MCFIIDSKSKLKPRPKTAKKDIIVYKLLDYSLCKRRFESIYQKQPYPVNKLIKIDKFGIKVTKDEHTEENTWTIRQGLHSYSSQAVANINRRLGDRIFRFKIPKGTKYYENDTEIVSLAIKRISTRPLKDISEPAIVWTFS